MSTEYSRAHLQALSDALAPYDVVTRLEGDTLIVTAPHEDDGGPALTERITCQERPEDPRRLWFTRANGEALTSSDEPSVAGAIVAAHLGA